MGIPARSILAAAFASGTVSLVACMIDIDGLTNGQCPDSKRVVGNKCVDIPIPGDIDECAAGTDDCDSTATCTNTAGGFTCACPSETLDVNGDGTKCSVDKCAAGTDDCDPTATCTADKDGFTCTCPPGSVDTTGKGTKCVTGDSCATPTVVIPGMLPVTLSGDTTTGSPHYGIGPASCPGVMKAVGGASSDKVYRFTPTSSDFYTFNLRTHVDGALYVVTDCSAIVTSCVGAVDTSCSDCTESLSVKLEAGQTYYIIVDGSSGTVNQAGVYDLLIRTSTVQIDVTPLLVHDTIANNGGAGGIDLTQDHVDGTSHDVPTQSVATRTGGDGSKGVPDDGFFAADANHPDVQLHWSNDDDGPNSRVVTSPGDTFTIDVPKDNYKQVQIYGFSASGSTTLSLTLTYDDGATDSRMFVFPDWYSDPAPSGLFYLIDGFDRYLYPMVDHDHDGAIFGASLDPDPAKKLVSISVVTAAVDNHFVFYGATAQ